MSGALLAERAQYVDASGVFSSFWLLLALPFVGALVVLMLGRKGDRWAPYLATALPLGAFGLALVYFFRLIGQDASARAIDLHLFSWVPVNGFNVDAGLLLDPLSMTFVLLITGVGSLIHIYSLGYLHGDPRRPVFFGYLNFFIGAMLTLVLADSYLLLYVGWEGVGLASYLLISFYFWRPSAATAGNKAFFANRVGDVGLSLAIMAMFAAVGSTSFAGVFGAAGSIGSGTVTLICLLLLLGACSKSGQFPLHTWLPDAMEGPTPVSALIHAATMVTAGVYLIVRSGPLFDLSDSARLVVAIIGGVTLLIGCIIGSVYDDIKKVLAYSTVSQIGYMFLAAGLGPAGYAIAILHLLAHGLFKATMFLGAGSVMHAMDDQVDMRRFGGLRSVMPITFGTFMAGYLAIIGCPPFSGFFTKDKIIEAAYDVGGAEGYILGTVALVGAGLTAFYMTRLMVMTFFGPRRWTGDVHPHESPAVMTGPMLLLGLGSIVGGFLLVLGGRVSDFLEPVTGQAAEVGLHSVNPTVLTVLTLLVAAGGVLSGYLFVYRRPVPLTPPVAVSPVTVAARNNLYFDAINESVLMRPGQYLTRALVFLDNRGIDGAVNGLAAAFGGSSGRLRRVQNGFVRSYGLTMFAGSAVLLAALLLVRL